MNKNEKRQKLFKEFEDKGIVGDIKITNSLDTMEEHAKLSDVDLLTIYGEEAPEGKAPEGKKQKYMYTGKGTQIVNHDPEGKSFEMYRAGGETQFALFNKEDVKKHVEPFPKNWTKV